MRALTSKLASKNSTRDCVDSMGYAQEVQSRKSIREITGHTFNGLLSPKTFLTPSVISSQGISLVTDHPLRFVNVNAQAATSLFLWREPGGKRTVQIFAVSKTITALLKPEPTPKNIELHSADGGKQEPKPGSICLDANMFVSQRD
jgi:hypothetical protein